jgi:hypothetical protein
MPGPFPGQEEESMTKMLATAAGLGLCLASAAGVAADPPVPRLFQGMPTDKGQWRMEILELVTDGKRDGRAAPAMTICSDNLMRQSRERGDARRDAEDEACTHRLLKDTPSETQMESVCKDATTRVNMKREGPKTVLMESESSGKRGTTGAKLRYTYEGACREGQAGLGFDRNSDACKEMRAQSAELDPATACAQAGAQREMCERQMRETVGRMQAMCK